MTVIEIKHRHLKQNHHLALEPKKRPTLKTIAQITGLGLTTVSKALKDAPDISAKTKERVKLIAAQIGYQPDRAGQRLRTGKTNIISLVLDTEEEVTSHASQVIIGISEALENSDYNLIVTPYSHKKDPMEPVRRIVETRAADGVILSRIEPYDRRLSILQEAGLPFATHGRSDMGFEHAYFDFDNTAFSQHAVRLLAELGRKHIGMITPPSQLAYGQYMQDGYQRGLQETGIRNCHIPSVTVDDSLEKIAEQVCRLFTLADKPDGLICGSVGATVGAVGGIEQAGLVVGKDVDIVSKQSTSNFLRWFGRPIYSVQEDFRAAGSGLANSIVKVIAGEPISDHQTVAYPEGSVQKVEIYKV